ncbi:MAG: glycosyltransferase family 4 protein [Anaerolineae bacterium]|nr:glycosyltransferase family 4 protein [Anaerolineae bacterium]MDW8299212.1 glycosyltransferase family 4 protein [Anaerolineae bacterium]
MRLVHLAKMTGVAGTENHLLALLPQLAKCGLDVRLIVLCEPEKPMYAYAAQMSAHGVPTELITIHSDLDLRLIGQLTARLRAIRADAVHTHLIHADWHGIPAARRAGVRYVYTSGHNDDPFRYRLPIRLVQAYLWRRVTAGIAISEAVRQFMIKVELAPPRKVHTVHYGIAPTPPDLLMRAVFRAELDIPLDAPVFGSVCRLIEQKGLTFALRAFAQIAPRFPEAHYVIVGDGALRESLRAEAEALGIAARVHFAGWRSDAAARMSAFDVFLMPSLWEGFGLATLEAMAAHLPIIASRVSALPEIVVDGITGFLCAPRDVACFAERMAQLLADRDLAMRLGANGAARLRAEFSVSKMVERTLAVYQRTGALRKDVS